MCFYENDMFGPVGTIVTVEAVVSRHVFPKDASETYNGKDTPETRLIFAVTVDGEDVAEHLWMMDTDANRFYGINVGTIVRVTGKVYDYWDSHGNRKQNIRYVGVTPTGRMANSTTMMRLCDTTHFKGEVEGAVYLIDRQGEVVSFGTDREARDRALMTMYFSRRR